VLREMNSLVLMSDFRANRCNNTGGKGGHVTPMYHIYFTEF